MSRDDASLVNLSDVRPRPARDIRKSHKLDDVCYEIRGPVLAEATRLEEEGHRILKLNIGNTAPFGLHTPEEILRDVIHNLPDSDGYCDSKGIFSARKAVMCTRSRVACAACRPTTSTWATASPN